MIKYISVTFVILFAVLTVNAQEQSSGKVSKNNEGTDVGGGAVSFSVVEKAPVYPGCKNSPKDEARDCFSRNIQDLFVNNFNFNLPNELGLPVGKNRSLIFFTINRSGGINNVKVTANHPRMKDEMQRIVVLLPKIKPGSQRGKAVNIKFAFPFTINVQ